ncbi:hypothetical protein K7I13_15290 [Brucepastera parasyntrophica]|uniref:hypothetical protein n=1 Tax=Brucepastera parasyntrophica TaxID=2880008 RepID=UPI0021094526|nr:hypothetical protein [Brucepastera parasyntrophica]ULQ59787.1 hypothetical protein K7I13_15290 [Brucepastera parasyntrophica]
MGLLIFSLFSAVLLYAENIEYHFGPDSGTHFVLTTPYHNNEAVIRQLHEFAETLKQNPPDKRISIIISMNDFSDLPDDLKPEYPEGRGILLPCSRKMKREP